VANVRSLLLQDLHKPVQGRPDECNVDHGPLGEVVEVFFFLRRKVFALKIPCCPVFTHHFDCCFVSDVWKDTTDSPLVTILSRTPSPVDHMSLRMQLHLSTLSFFWSLFSSLGRQQENFFLRPRSSNRILVIVSLPLPRTEASHLTLRRRSSSSAVATAATMSFLSLVFFIMGMRLISLNFLHLNFFDHFVYLCTL
jgi:hypothetical protein